MFLSWESPSPGQVAAAGNHEWKHEFMSTGVIYWDDELPACAMSEVTVLKDGLFLAGRRVVCGSNPQPLVPFLDGLPKQKGRYTLEEPDEPEADTKEPNPGEDLSATLWWLRQYPRWRLDVPWTKPGGDREPPEGGSSREPDVQPPDTDLTMAALADAVLERRDRIRRELESATDEFRSGPAPGHARKRQGGREAVTVMRSSAKGDGGDFMCEEGNLPKYFETLLDEERYDDAAVLGLHRAWRAKMNWLYARFVKANFSHTWLRRQNWFATYREDPAVQELWDVSAERPWIRARIEEIRALHIQPGEAAPSSSSKRPPAARRSASGSSR